MKLTSKRIIEWLAEKYKLPQWALFAEVCDATGDLATRRADAIALSLCKQECHEQQRVFVRGFEIKVSRNDWLRELADMNKSETMRAYCNEWILVAPTDVVSLDEIPEGWGWYIPKIGEMHRFAKRPIYNEDVKLDIDFVASLVRSSAKKSQQIDEIKKILDC
jgi:hypothetical protein